ncbi:hypothetical protein [Allomesorhizobium alhagi]|uniref:Lipoprotein n=1 Tax=Mesorhizobium alhagi CCNWXJ12-2 TaxID=1107882 RepID=H0HR19_9HYPH|nr:hypothetical protein [Mesorhizobium alhagi]EHK56799.1 hypothetical protein MAXJ12_13011 [Mesorhizobium alhagi CCNWXJ12-2]
MKRTIMLAAACAVLAGCTQTPGKGNLAVIGPLPAAGIVNTNAAQVGTVAVAATVPAGAFDLGEVDGTSCKNSLLDPAPTEEKALVQLKQKAADRGANGVAAIKYDKGGLSYSTNCWSTVTAIGRAFQ